MAAVLKKITRPELMIVCHFSSGDTMWSFSIPYARFYHLFIALTGCLLLAILLLLFNADSVYSVDASETEDSSLTNDASLLRQELIETADLSEKLLEMQTEISRLMRGTSDRAEQPVENSLSSMSEIQKTAENRFLPGVYLKRRFSASQDIILGNTDFGLMYQKAIVPVPHRWPVQSSKLVINSLFGRRNSPWYSWGASSEFHSGLDINARIGDRVLATASGRVRTVRRGSDGYGNMVRIVHPSGYDTLYAHLSSIQVKPDQQVAPGEIIGQAGSTGSSTGPHLHYEVIGQRGSVDPLLFLAP